MENNKQHSDIAKELRQIAPGLSELKPEDGFTVPHNYFKELPDRVWAKIAEETPVSVTVWNRLQDILKPRYANRSLFGFYPGLAFASVLVLITAGIWYVQLKPAQDPLALITQAEALEYVLDNLQDFSSEDLIAAGVLEGWDTAELSPMSGDDLDQMMNEIIEDENMIDALMMN